MSKKPEKKKKKWRPLLEYIFERGKQKSYSI